MTTLATRILTPLAMVIGAVVCEPKLRLGRWRHDGTCDRCNEPCGSYAMDHLDFPLDDVSPEASSSREKLRAMFNAEYERFCLECAAELEDDNTSIEEGSN